MKKFKYVALSFLALLGTASIISCGKKNNGNNDKTSEKQIDKCVLTTINSDLFAGTITNYNNLKLNIGTEIILLAKPQYGYSFDGWYYGENKISDETNYRFTIYSDLELTAKWHMDFKTYALNTINVDTKCGSISDYQDQRLKEGDEVSVSASANEGYEFDGWYEGNDKVSDSSLYTFNIDHNTVLFVRWKKSQGETTKYTLTTINDNSNAGNITSYTNQEFDEGASVTLTANKNSGFEFDGWYNGDEKISSSSSYTFNINSNLVLTAKWNENTHIAYKQEHFIYDDNEKKIIKGLAEGDFTEIVIPDGTTGIYDNAFDIENNFTSITLPSSIEWLGGDAFAKNNEINFYYDGTWIDYNNIYKSNNTATPVGKNGGYVYFLDEDGTTLHNGKKYSLQTNIILPEGITFFKNQLFSYFNHLESLYIPSSFAGFDGGFQFFNSSLSKIYYKGTEENWNNIINNTQYNSYLSNDVIIYYYSENEPTIEGNYWHYVDEKITIWGQNSNPQTNKYTLTTINDNSNAGNITSYTNQEFDEGASVTLTANKNSGFEFDGWYNGDEKISSSSSYTFNINSNLVLTAKWNENTHIAYKQEHFIYDDNEKKIIKGLAEGDFTEIVIPDGTTGIYDNAFDIENNFTSITLPSSIEWLGGDAFAKNNEINFYYDGTWIDYNNIYKSNNTATPVGKNGGYVYFLDEDGTTLHNGKKYSLQTNIILPEGITFFKNQLFSYFNHLESLYIPSSFAGFDGGFQFFNSSLSKIYYKGTEENWNNIINNTQYNSYLSNDVIIYYYSENEPTIEGNYWHYVDEKITIWGQNSNPQTNKYTLTTINDNSNAGNITSYTNQEFNSGESVTLTAEADFDYGYTFNGWYNGDTKVSSSSSYTFNINSNLTLTAKWVYYTLTTTPCYNSSNDVPDGKQYYNIAGTFTILENEKVSAGNTVTLVCVPKEESVTFVGWYKVNASSMELLSTNQSYTYTMTEQDTIIRAKFLLYKYVENTNNKVIEYGFYPQSKVTDDEIKQELDKKIGNLPDAEHDYDWKNYNYYDDDTISNYMWYKDIDLDNDGVKDYRAVYFIKYRGSKTTMAASIGNSYVDNNGYELNNVYYFKFEPVLWDILETTTYGDTIIMSRFIIDAQNWYINTSNRIDGLNTIYPTNYEESSIKNWLNNDFYDTVFDLYRHKNNSLNLTDNSVQSTGKTTNDYALDGIFSDKVYLMSVAEFNQYIKNNNTLKKASSTDYAKIQGLNVSTTSTTAGYSAYWTRSPQNSNINATNISNQGSTSSQVVTEIYGIRPLLDMFL